MWGISMAEVSRSNLLTGNHADYNPITEEELDQFFTLVDISQLTQDQQKYVRQIITDGAKRNPLYRQIIRTQIKQGNSVVFTYGRDDVQFFIDNSAWGVQYTDANRISFRLDNQSGAPNTMDLGAAIMHEIRHDQQTHDHMWLRDGHYSAEAVMTANKVAEAEAVIYSRVLEEDDTRDPYFGPLQQRAREQIIAEIDSGQRQVPYASGLTVEEQASARELYLETASMEMAMAQCLSIRMQPDGEKMAMRIAELGLDPSDSYNITSWQASYNSQAYSNVVGGEYSLSQDMEMGDAQIAGEARVRSFYESRYPGLQGTGFWQPGIGADEFMRMGVGSMPPEVQVGQVQQGEFIIDTRAEGEGYIRDIYRADGTMIYQCHLNKEGYRDGQEAYYSPGYRRSVAENGTVQYAGSATMQRRVWENGVPENSKWQSNRRGMNNTGTNASFNPNQSPIVSEIYSDWSGSSLGIGETGDSVHIMDDRTVSIFIGEEGDYESVGAQEFRELRGVPLSRVQRNQLYNNTTRGRAWDQITYQVGDETRRLNTNTMFQINESTASFEDLHEVSDQIIQMLNRTPQKVQGFLKRDPNNPNRFTYTGGGDSEQEIVVNLERRQPRGSTTERYYLSSIELRRKNDEGETLFQATFDVENPNRTTPLSTKLSVNGTVEVQETFYENGMVQSHEAFWERIEYYQSGSVAAFYDNFRGNEIKYYDQNGSPEEIAQNPYGATEYVSLGCNGSGDWNSGQIGIRFNQDGTLLNVGIYDAGQRKGRVLEIGEEGKVVSHHDINQIESTREGFQELHAPLRETNPQNRVDIYHDLSPTQARQTLTMGTRNGPPMVCVRGREIDYQGIWMRQPIQGKTADYFANMEGHQTARQRRDLLYQRTTQRGAWDSFRYSSGNPPQEQVLETPIQELSTTILQGIGSNGDVQAHMTSLGFIRDAQNPNRWVLDQNGERTSVILSDKRYERGENDQVIEIQDPSSLRIAEMTYEKPSAQASVTVQFYGDGVSPQQTEVRVGSHSARETFYPDGQVSAHYEKFDDHNCRIEYYPSGAPKYVGTCYWDVSYYDRARHEETTSSNSPYGPIKKIDMGCGTPAQSGIGTIQMEFRPDGMPMTVMIRESSTQKGHLVHLDEEGMMISHVPMIGQYGNNMQMHGVYEDWNGNKMTYVYGARFNGTPEEYDALVVQGQERVRDAIHAKNTAQIDRILAQVPGFSFNYIDPETKESPLMSAVRNGDQQMVTHLLRNGCNVNMEPASQQEGYTLMQAAIESGNASMVECLINNGVKVNGTKQGQAAMDMLASLPNPTAEHRRMQEILTRNGAVASRNNAQASAGNSQSVTATFVAHHSSEESARSAQTATAAYDGSTAVSEPRGQSEGAVQPKNQAENSEARGDASARLRTSGNAVSVGANPLQENGHQR